MPVYDHVEVMRDQGELQFKHRSELYLPPLPGIEQKDASKVAARLISLAPVMEVTMTAKEGRSANGHWYYFEDDDCAPFTMQFLEYTDGLTLEYFLAWRALQINKDGTYNPPDYYKKDLYIYFMTYDDIALRRFKLVGCFIDKLAAGDITYAGSEAQVIDVSITYDGPNPMWPA